MLMFSDALREAARRRQDKKSNIPSRNDCFSAKKKTKTEFYSEDKKKNIYRKKRKKNCLNVFYLNFATALRYGTTFSNS